MVNGPVVAMGAPHHALSAGETRQKRFFPNADRQIYLALLGVGYMFFQGQEAEVQDRLDAQESLNQALRADIASLAPAADLERQLLDGSAQIQQVLATDVAWGRLLNDLGRVIPDRVWLDSFAARAERDPENPAALGTVSMNGTAFDYPDAASWLRTLDSDRWPAVGAGWVLNTAQEEIVNGVAAVTFSSVGTLTTSALDDRIDERVPTVPE